MGRRWVAVCCAALGVRVYAYEAIHTSCCQRAVLWHGCSSASTLTHHAAPSAAVQRRLGLWYALVGTYRSCHIHAECFVAQFSFDVVHDVEH